MTSCSFLLLFCSFTCVLIGQSYRIDIGGLFSAEEAQQIFAFEHSQGDAQLYVTFDPHTERNVNKSNPLQYKRAMCSLLNSIVTVLFATPSPQVDPLLSSYTRDLGIPLVTTDEFVRRHEHPMKIRLRPEVAGALNSVVNYFNWTKLYYVYEDSFTGWVRMESFLEALHAKENPPFPKVHFIKIFDAQSAKEHLRKMWRHEKKESEGGHGNQPRVDMILDASGPMTEDLLDYLHQRLDMRMHFHVLVGNLEGSYSVNWWTYTEGILNVTALYIVNPDGDFVKAQHKEPLRPLDPKLARSEPRHGLLESALMKDALNVTRRGLKRFMSPKFLPPDANRCDRDNIKPWKLGVAVADNIKRVNDSLYTGHVAFDKHGYRVGYTLHVVHVGKRMSDPSKIATWTQGFHPEFNLEPPVKLMAPHNEGPRKERSLIVSTLVSLPYCFLVHNETGEQLTDMNHPNAKYAGYIVDLMDRISKHANFTYRLKLVEDGKHGNPEEDGSWNGLVGDVVKGEADLAAADLTITSTREEVIYFSKPFLSLGISIMIKKPEQRQQNVFSFTTPLAKEVWMCIGFASVGVSVVLFLVSRFSPYEWVVDTSGPIPVMKNAFSIWNSLWFTISALMQQGCEVAPRSVSSRIVASVWYLFTLIIISSYTANLAAFLTAARMNTPIEGAEDLAQQTVIKYGSTGSGSTKMFFQLSKFPVYQKMWSFMKSEPGVMVWNTSEGIRKVRESSGKYAFLVESTTNEYVSSRSPCDTMKVGGNLNSRGYGIGMPLDSSKRDDINIAILVLREQGELAKLEKKWWYETGEVCPEEPPPEGNELTVSKIAGIFYILTGGLLIGILGSALELVCRCKVESTREKKDFWVVLRYHVRMSLGKKERDGSGTTGGSTSPSHDQSSRDGPSDSCFLASPPRSAKVGEDNSVFYRSSQSVQNPAPFESRF